MRREDIYEYYNFLFCFIGWVVFCSQVYTILRLFNVIYNFVFLFCCNLLYVCIFVKRLVLINNYQDMGSRYFCGNFNFYFSGFLIFKFMILVFRCFWYFFSELKNEFQEKKEYMCNLLIYYMENNNVSIGQFI